MRWLRFLLPAAVLVALLLWVDLGQVVAALGGMSGRILAVAFLLSVCDRLLMTYKWRQLVLAGGGPLSFPEALRIHFQAGVSGRVVPSTIGGDVLRAWLATRARVPKGLALGSVTVEKAIGLLSSAALALLGLLHLAGRMPEGASATPLIAAAVAVLLAAIAAFALLFDRSAHRAGARLAAWIARRVDSRGRVQERLGRLAKLPAKTSRALLRYRRRPRALLANGALAVGEHLLQLVKLLVIAVGVGIALPALHFLAVAAAVLLVRRAGALLDGWGAGEGGAVIAFVLLGVPAELAVALVVANFAVTTVTVLPGALLFWTHPVTPGPVAREPRDEVA